MSLRQTLFQLKRVLAKGAVISTRDRCRLSEQFVIKCDTQASVGVDRGIFMPDLWEPWCCAIRDSISMFVAPKATAELLSRPGPVEGLRQLLTWSLDKSARRTVQLLRDNVDVADGLTAADLSPIIEAALERYGADDPLFGWVVYWKGKQCFSSDMDAARPWMRRAISLAREHGDTVLEAESIYWLGVAEIITGRVAAAERLAQVAQNLGEKRSDRLLAARAADLFAHTNLHHGNLTECLRLLEQAGLLYADRSSFKTTALALRALYTAIGGQVAQAERLLEVSEREFSTGDHVALGLLSALARGHLSLRSGELDSAALILEEVSSAASSSSNEHIEVYAREALAGTRWKQREKAAAAGQIGHSNRIRRRLKMRVTAWDRSRLSEMPISYK